MAEAGRCRGGAADECIETALAEGSQRAASGSRGTGLGSILSWTLGDPHARDLYCPAHIRCSRATPQPHAGTRPIFLHAEPCKARSGADLPPMLASARYIVRGYGPDDRIVYGTDQVGSTRDIPAVSEELLGRADVAYVHVRSVGNNCYQVLIDRAA